jgi:hypothetical protein
MPGEMSLASCVPTTGVFQNIGDLGKLGGGMLCTRGMCPAIPCVEARDFYPLLAEVGKDVVKGTYRVVYLPFVAVHKSNITSLHVTELSLLIICN